LICKKEETVPKRITPDLTIVGGQPERPLRKRQVEVPVGLEQLLYLAAKDPGLEASLLADRQKTLTRLGIQLRPTEAVTLAAVSDKTLRGMIGRIKPENPRGRKIMKIVAATATSLAAGTAVIGCDVPDESAGDRIDVEIDGGEDAGEDTE
jgi:hypothetical protein